ncbi:hypothetical protein D1872_289390 [compost metagenome]
MRLDLINVSKHPTHCRHSLQILTRDLHRIIALTQRSLIHVEATNTLLNLLLMLTGQLEVAGCTAVYNLGAPLSLLYHEIAIMALKIIRTMLKSRTLGTVTTISHVLVQSTHIQTQ